MVTEYYSEDTKDKDENIHKKLTRKHNSWMDKRTKRVMEQMISNNHKES